MHGSASSEALETPNQQLPYLQVGLAPSSVWAREAATSMP